MDFNGQMRAVIQVIWTMRSSPPQGVEPGRRKLNHSAVAREALAILREQMPEDQRDKARLDRQNWLAANCAAEWKAIRRAIDGEEPLLGQEDVEVEIAKFDVADPNKALARENSRLHSRIVELESIVAGHRRAFDDFRAKAYNEQYVTSLFREDFAKYQRRAAEMTATATDLRKKLSEYQATVQTLTDEKSKLEVLVKQKGATQGGSPRFKCFSPDISNLSDNSDDNALVADYLSAVTKEWNRMLEAADKNKPGDIYLVFHSFNLDPAEFASKKIPMSPGVLNYAFFCCQPRAERRKKMYIEAAGKIAVPPCVVLVMPSRTTGGDKSSVVQLKPSKGLIDRLRDRLTKGRGIDPYDPIEEGYHQVLVERVDA